jgi:hypothetical protein
MSVARQRRTRQDLDAAYAAYLQEDAAPAEAWDGDARRGDIAPLAPLEDAFVILS